MAPITNVKKRKAVVLAALLDMKDSALVTLEAGETRLAAHSAVLAARSPVFQSMFRHDTLEAATGQVSIPDVEGAVLRQLLSYCYTLQAPQLPATAPQLLAAADKYGLLALKSVCEQQVVAQLANENAAASAVLGVRHSCPNVTAAAVAFIREHDFQALASQGWADAMLKQPADLIEVSQLLAEPSSKTRMDRVTPIVKIKDTASVDLSAMLDAGDNAMVTLVAGETRLVAHRAVLAASSSVLKAKFHSDTLEENSGQVTVPDMEGPVLRQLLAYCYTLQAPEDRCTAPQLLVVADRYGLSSLKAACERQVAADLTVRNAAAAAALAVRHSCPDLTVAAVAFIKAHLIHVLGTQCWADMMRNHSEYLIKVSHLLAEPPPAEIKNDIMAPITNVKKMNGVDLGALLDMKDTAVVTMEAGETRLAAHSAVLAARSPVFQAMFRHDTLEAATGQVSIPDVEGPVLRQLLSYCYTLQAPQLPAIAPQLLVAADKYGLLALKSVCEQHVVAQLANENAAASAVLGVRHSCPNVTAAAVAFIREHDFQALASQGWADAMLKQPADLIEVSQLLAEPSSETRMDRVTPIVKIKDTVSVDLSAMLDAGDNAMVTLVAGETRLVAHRAVLAARSSVLKAKFHSDTLEENSGQLTVPDMEGPVLRQLLAYCYTLQAPEDRCTASQLLVAADRYGLSSLKAACEWQVAADLTVRNAAAAAALAVRHSCPHLTSAAFAFIKAHLIHVLGTQCWADMMRNHPEDMIKVSHLLDEPPPAEIKSLSAEEKGERLIEAAQAGELEELWVLLASGADLRATDEKGTSALHLAAGEGHFDVVRCLVDIGAEVDARGSNKYTPLHFASYGGHLAVMRFLAASSADVDARCGEGRTALHWAAEAGHTEAVALLLELGADKEARDKEWKTPLQISRQKNCQEVTELLTQIY